MAPTLADLDAAARDSRLVRYTNLEQLDPDPTFWYQNLQADLGPGGLFAAAEAVFVDPDNGIAAKPSPEHITAKEIQLITQTHHAMIYQHPQRQQLKSQAKAIRGLLTGVGLEWVQTWTRKGTSCLVVWVPRYGSGLLTCQKRFWPQETWDCVW